jgi:hypothetical protein
MSQSIEQSENEIKKIKEQKLVEESDNKLTQDLFSNNPHVIDKSSNVNIIKLDKNKFASVMKPVIVEEKNIVPVKKENQVTKIKNKCFDLNDYDYDYDYIEF